MKRVCQRLSLSLKESYHCSALSAHHYCTTSQTSTPRQHTEPQEEYSFIESIEALQQDNAPPAPWMLRWDWWVLNILLACLPPIGVWAAALSIRHYVMSKNTTISLSGVPQPHTSVAPDVASEASHSQEQMLNTVREQQGVIMSKIQKLEDQIQLVSFKGLLYQRQAVIDDNKLTELVNKLTEANKKRS